METDSLSGTGPHVDSWHMCTIALQSRLRASPPLSDSGWPPLGSTITESPLPRITSQNCVCTITGHQPSCTFWWVD